jgi:hypothetical protein
MWTREQSVSKEKHNRKLELLDKSVECQGLSFVVASQLPYAVLKWCDTQLHLTPLLPTEHQDHNMVLEAGE